MSAYKEWAASRIITKGEELFERYGDQDMAVPGDGHLLPGELAYDPNRSSWHESREEPVAHHFGAPGPSGLNQQAEGDEMPSGSREEEVEEEALEEMVAGGEQDEDEDQGPTANARGKRKARN